MQTLPIRSSFLPNEGRIDIACPISDGLALEFERQIDVHFSYYGYADVTLRLHSPGGQLLALQHILAVVARWRRQERRVHVRATMHAGSAAAVLLALGEVGTRHCQQHTSLLFHHSRFIAPAEQSLTALAASAAVQHLASVDAMLLDQIAQHLVHAHGSARALGLAGRARCEYLCQQVPAGQDRSSAGGRARSPAWLKQAASAYEETARRGQATAYVRLLNEVFDRDEAMDLRRAWGLQLIDSIEGLPLPQTPLLDEALPDKALPGPSGRAVQLELPVMA